MKYFEDGIHINQRQYVVQMLSKTEMTFAMVVGTSVGKNMVWMKLLDVL